MAVLAEAVQSIVECPVSNISSGSGGGVQSKYAEMNAMLVEVETLAKNKLGSLLLQLRLVSLSSVPHYTERVTSQLWLDQCHTCNFIA